MYLCYIDESGTPDIPGNTSHFILAGIAIPADRWKQCDKVIAKIKQDGGIKNYEIHTAWMLRPYLEQHKIPNFDKFNHSQRRSAVITFRKRSLYHLQKTNPKMYHKTKKIYKKTDPYIHLTHDERKALVIKFSKIIGNWRYARLFAECVDKIHFDPTRTKQSVEEQAFEQVVSRFEHYLQNISTPRKRLMGMLIHDNNETLSARLTNLMILFHRKGTFWTRIKNIIETPLFVDSRLTSMVQAADLCSYALRRYFENNEDYLFKNIFKIADRKDNRVVGVRHFSTDECDCEICTSA